MAEDRQIAELYQRFGPVVYRRCLRLLGDREEAQDATQQIFIKLLKSPRRFVELDEALPWIHTVTTNWCLNAKRDARRRGEHLDAMGKSVDFTSEPHQASEDQQLARAALERVDAETRDIAVGMLINEKQQQEVAAELGVSEKTVQRKLKRFLENARKALGGKS